MTALTIIPKTLDEVSSMAEMLAKSTLLPDALKGKAPDVVVQILAGQELGLAPMAAIRGVHIVQGKPVLSADTMVGLVLGSGAAEYFICVEESAEKVTYECKRKGAPQPQRCTWTIDDIKKAGLNTKDTHRLYGRAMLKARCKAMLARDAFPDILAGVYDPSEDIDVPMVERRVPVADIIDAELATEPPELALIATAETPEVLKALAPQLAQVAEEWKQVAKDRYAARLKELRGEKAA